ncbi:hypothetical protein D3C81_1350090 [compost metagenome]
MGSLEFVTQVGQHPQAVVNPKRRLVVHHQHARVGQLPCRDHPTKALLIQAQRATQGLCRLRITTHGDLQRTQFAQSLEITRLILEHIVQGPLGQRIVAPLAVDTSHPHQRIVTFGIQLSGAQILVQRLISVPRTVSRCGHAHGLFRCVGALLYLIEHRAAAVVQIIAALADTLPRGLATCQRGSKRCQKCNPMHLTISRRP